MTKPKVDQTIIQLYGAEWCTDSRRVKTYLEENHIDFTYINVDINPEAAGIVNELHEGEPITPTLVINELPFSNPTNEKIAALLGLNEGRPRVRLLGADWCPDCHRAKAYLSDNGIHYQYINIDQHPWTIPVLEGVNNGKRIVPTIFIDETAYANPDNRTLKELLDITEEVQKHLYDVAIIGGGATGLTSAIYIQRDKFSSVVLEKRNIGGNAFLTEKIENYPGFTNISGPELMARMAEQARIYGTDFKLGADVRKITQEEGVFHLETSLGDFTAHSIIVAVGSTYRRLNIPGEKELIGAGVHFCATCDGAFYRNREVIVIGGGNSALEEGIFLARFCKKVKIVHYKPAFSASATYIDKLPDLANIEVYLDQTPMAFLSNDRQLFRAIQVKNNVTDELSEIEADGAFIFAGLVPNTKFLSQTLALSEQGFIQTKAGTVETSVSGVFAAGDCREGAIAQVAAATGEGVIASFAVKSYLNKSRP